MRELTRDDISGVDGILVFDEAKTIHELDLCDGAWGLFEVGLDILLGDCSVDGAGSAEVL